MAISYLQENFIFRVMTEDVVEKCKNYTCKKIAETVNITTRKFLVSKSEDRGSLKTVKTESSVKDVEKF